MNFSIQPTLENERIKLVPLTTTDFEAMYQVASDPEIWMQHPNKDRWKHEVFESFFEGAIDSKGAFKIIDKESGEIAGCTRFYNYDETDKSILIGYTFYATAYWGKGINPSVKKLMMDYIFQYVDKVLFHVGATNLRSQIAVTRLGAKKIAEENVAYYGEPAKLNFVYEIEKEKYLHQIFI
uniref:GNAT family N-acetyltransferase n=1 Tax=Pedobacter schmidteae TaxID=2201271 RepID=UPI000EB4E359|nr:GNAT family N-acetyltransferase [Pedobacter schmidteae]